MVKNMTTTAAFKAAHNALSSLELYVDQYASTAPTLNHAKSLAQMLRMSSEFKEGTIERSIVACIAEAIEKFGQPTA